MIAPVRVRLSVWHRTALTADAAPPPSPFIADHVCGLGDFPAARFVFLRDAYDDVRNRRGLGAVTAGFLPDLIPADFDGTFF